MSINPSLLPITTHARERSVERFGYDVCDQVYDQITSGSTVILKKTTDQQVHHYKVDGVSVLAVWNLHPEKLITVYPDTEENRKKVLQQQFKYLADRKGNRNRMSNKFNSQKKKAVYRQNERELTDDIE